MNTKDVKILLRVLIAYVANGGKTKKKFFEQLSWMDIFYDCDFIDKYYNVFYKIAKTYINRTLDETMLVLSELTKRMKK